MEKNFIITIQALLKDRNEEFEMANPQRIKLIRHKEKKNSTRIINGKEYKNSLYDLYLHENDVFMRYQSEQLVNNFKNVDYIVSFIGEDGKDSRFVGVYKNCGIKQMLPDHNGKAHALFDLQEVNGFEILKERVVIEWNNPRNWLQHYKNEMHVVRIDRGLTENNIPVFTRFEDVILNYSQLQSIFKYNNQEWKAKLESCNCIYLILDKNTGKQYVGSTYNSKGVWGRWEEYANTGHGNDVSLIALLADDAKYAEKYFQWCILETLPLKILPDQAIDRESLYKRKFGTRDFGYNNN